MNLDNVKALQIDGHTVASLSVGGVVVWQAGSAWEDPVQSGDTLTITQIHSAVQSDSTLEVA